MSFRRMNSIALKRLAGPVTITPPGGSVYQCQGLFERPYDDEHSGDARIQRAEPTLTISDEETVALERGAAISVTDVDGTFVGDYTLQRTEPDDTGVIRLHLRSAKS